MMEIPTFDFARNIFAKKKEGKESGRRRKVLTVQALHENICVQSTKITADN